MAGTFGVGTPFAQFTQTTPWGPSPYGTQGLNLNPFALQQLYGQPISSHSSGSVPGAQLQQIAQLLQLVPQQLQQLEQLQLQQLQQLQQVQQLVQVVPAQLAQLTQFASRQIHPSPQLQQPFSHFSGLGSPTPMAWGTLPQIAGQQPSQIM